MGSNSFLYFIILIPFLIFILFIYNKKNETTNNMSRKGGEPIKNMKPVELTNDLMAAMTVDEISLARGRTHRATIAYLARNGISCLDFDASLSLSEKIKNADAALAQQKEKDVLGILSEKVVCPHCHVKGQVYKKLNVERRETMTDTTNITAAILSGTKTTVKKVTMMTCKECDMSWDV